MPPKQPTLGERLSRLEGQFEALNLYVRNDMRHRIGRIEVAVYALVLGVAGTLATVLGQLVTR